MRAAALLVMSVGTLGIVSPLRAEIPWQTNLKAAHEQAVQQGKLLLLHFYSDHCVYCDQLEEGAFRSPALAESITRHYVPVKVHAGQNPTLASTFRVTRWPTDVIVNTDGIVLSHGVSPQAPAEYIAMLTQHSPSAPGRDTALARSTAPTQSAPPQSAPPLAVSLAHQPQVNPYAPPAAAQPAPPHQGPPHQAQLHQGQPAPPYPDGYHLPPHFGGTAARLAGHREEGIDLVGPGAPRVPANRPAPAGALAPSGALATLGHPDGTAGSAVDAGLALPQDPAAAAAGSPAMPPRPPLAMDGYCPVSVVDGDTWVAGDPALGVIHLGQLYLFADAGAMEKFLANPTPYTPVMNGIDVVRFFEERRVVPGSREWSVMDKEFNRMFFFADEASMDHFVNAYQRYTRSAIEVTRQAALEANASR